jgi:hypothetical protein
MESLPLPSGRTLKVAIAPFSVANKLKKIIAAELRTVKIDVDVSKLDLDLDLSKMDAKALNTMKDIVCTLLASDSVERAFFECAARCTIDGVKITPGTDKEAGSFDDIESRPDFIPVAWEVIRANVGPFFQGLGSLFSTAQKAETDDPASK